MSDETIRFDLPQSAIPTRWYNIQADLPRPLPPVLHPATHKPVGPEDLAPLFPMALIGQEVSTERWIEIPEEVREIYKLWRPTPLIRARRLEKALDTPAHIYFKYEGVSPSGSHKLNTAVPQAYYNKQQGVQGLTTETGAGQWGTALSIASNYFDLECLVYMVKVSYEQKPYRRAIIQSFGANVTPSPSDTTEAGRRFLAENPDSTGSLGMAISEAVEVAATSGGKYKYALGSVLNHVLMHQTVIGQEALLQLRRADAYPDVVIGCTGGGSNFAGIAFPFIRNNINHGANTRIVAVEPAACPTLTRGAYAYDYGDTAGMAPVVKMHTLGANFVPAPLHAGGLRYHGMASIISELLDQDMIEALALPQLEVFGAALQFLRTEGIVPAPEPSHAIAAVIREALAAKEAGEKRTILFNLCGHGHFDMAAYDAYNKGELSNYEYPQEAIDAAMAKVPQIEGHPIVLRSPTPAPAPAPEAAPAPAEDASTAEEAANEAPVAAEAEAEAESEVESAEVGDAEASEANAEANDAPESEAPEAAAAESEAAESEASEAEAPEAEAPEAETAEDETPDDAPEAEASPTEADDEADVEPAPVEASEAPETPDVAAPEVPAPPMLEVPKMQGVEAPDIPGFDFPEMDVPQIPDRDDEGE